jgi:hypothetical protein
MTVFDQFLNVVPEASMWRFQRFFEWLIPVTKD